MDIIEMVGTEYTGLGLWLLEDDYGYKLEQIESDCHNISADIVVKILLEWIHGRRRQPVTWKTLIEVLNIVGFTELASTIQASLASRQSSSS